MLYTTHPKLLILVKGIIVTFALIGFFLVAGYVAVSFGFTNTTGIIDTQTKTFIPKQKTTITYESFPLAHSPEWISFRQSVAKDAPMLQKIYKETGVQPRILVAILVPEQMRLFHSDRAIFKQFFEPLKMLGSQSQFSWGIFGIKDDTARDVENHLTDATSPYYLGKSFEQSLAFTTDTPDQERFNRITDDKDHLYSYRYAALYIKQLQTQWKKAGFPIEDNPAVLATLWNLGFVKSKPHANPSSGGAVIDIEGTEYSFGELARLFYYSDEMIEIFPRE
jgi:hypothetical protein